MAVQLRYYFIYFPTMGQSLARHGAHGLGAGLLLLPLSLGDQYKGAIRAVMRSWVFASLGAISYGLYLWHPGFVKLFFRMGLEGEVPRGRWWQLLFVVAASIVVATVTYWGVERPAMDLSPSRRRRRAEARRAAASVAAPPTTSSFPWARRIISKSPFRLRWCAAAWPTSWNSNATATISRNWWTNAPGSWP